MKYLTISGAAAVVLALAALAAISRYTDDDFFNQKLTVIVIPTQRPTIQPPTPVPEINNRIQAEEYVLQRIEAIMETWSADDNGSWSLMSSNEKEKSK